MIVSCPTCSRPVEWSEGSPWRPFCSERCKLIDLGAWATEKHAIPDDGTSKPIDGDELEADESKP